MTGKPINYVKGDATDPQGCGYQILVHCCNNVGAWGAGFVLAVSAKWPGPEAHYRKLKQFELELGRVDFIHVEYNKRRSLYVANLIGQEGIGPHKYSGRAPIRYDAIDLGLQVVSEKAQSLFASVHMPRMGCGLAGGDWRVIEALINKNLCDYGIPVTVYDL